MHKFCFCIFLYLMNSYNTVFLSASYYIITRRLLYYYCCHCFMINLVVSTRFAMMFFFWFCFFSDEDIFQFPVKARIHTVPCRQPSLTCFCSQAQRWAASAACWHPDSRAGLWGPSAVEPVGETKQETSREPSLPPDDVIHYLILYLTGREKGGKQQLSHQTSIKTQSEHKQTHKVWLEMVHAHNATHHFSRTEGLRWSHLISDTFGSKHRCHDVMFNTCLIHKYISISPQHQQPV